MHFELMESLGDDSGRCISEHSTAVQSARNSRAETFYLIREKDVRRFILPHPTEIDLRKVDQLWFLDLITKRTGAVKVAHIRSGDEDDLEPREGNCRSRLPIRALRG